MGIVLDRFQVVFCCILLCCDLTVRRAAVFCSLPLSQNHLTLTQEVAAWPLVAENGALGLLGPWSFERDMPKPNMPKTYLGIYIIRWVSKIMHSNASATFKPGAQLRAPPQPSLSPTFNPANEISWIIQADIFHQISIPHDSAIEHRCWYTL